jgi:cobalt-zinc-cadmium efflux system membrane fusion protein
MKTYYKLIVVISWLLSISQSTVVFAHSGHGNEFKHEDNNTIQPLGIEVDTDTQKRLGIITQAVNKQRLNFGIKTTGQIEFQPQKQTQITAPTAGTVTELLVQPGELVNQGQTVAVISSPELLELRTEAFDRSTEAEASLREAQANLYLARENYDREQQIAQTVIAASQTAVKIAQENYDRDKQLVSEGALPRREMLDSQNRLLTVKSDLQKAIASREVLAAQTEVKRAKVEVDAAQSRLKLALTNYRSRLQQLNTTANALGLVTILAPISGNVAHLDITLGESIEDRGTRLMSIVDNREVLATAHIQEADLIKVKIGQQVRVKARGIRDRTFVSQIAQIDSTVNGDTRVVAVRAKLNNPSGELKPGMFAELEIFTAQTAEEVLAVPTSAVIDANGKELVYIENGVNSFQPVEVTLGENFGELVAIEGSLFEGDRLVTEGATMLYAQSLRGGTVTKTIATSSNLTVSSFNSLDSLGKLSSFFKLTAVGGAIAGAFFWGRNSRKKSQSTK